MSFTVPVLSTSPLHPGATTSVASGSSQIAGPSTAVPAGSALSSIVEEMGEALVRASYSTNIKERRDCSTALLDRSGTSDATGTLVLERS